MMVRRYIMPENASRQQWMDKREREREVSTRKREERKEEAQ